MQGGTKEICTKTKHLVFKTPPCPNENASQGLILSASIADCLINSAASADRGLMLHLNGFGSLSYLSHHAQYFINLWYLITMYLRCYSWLQLHARFNDVTIFILRFQDLTGCQNGDTCQPNNWAPEMSSGADPTNTHALMLNPVILMKHDSPATKSKTKFHIFGKFSIKCTIFVQESLRDEHRRILVFLRIV